MAHDPPPPSGTVEELVRLKGASGRSISACLPALNEAATIGAICRTIRRLLEAGLLDQLVVVDSGSSDDTRAVAYAEGAEVLTAAELIPGVVAPGKGGTLWKSLGVVTSDIVLWLDSDTRNFNEGFVTRLVEPFLRSDETRMTKAFYERPLGQGSTALTTGGARVTELVVRPLAHLLFPELVDFVQPLSGEYAAYRDDLIRLPFFSGYGVEVGLLIDFITTYGAEGIRQVDLGTRVHRNQDVLALGRMAFEVMQVMTRRAEDLGRLKLGTEWPTSMKQFVPSDDGTKAISYELPVIELPPLASVL